MKTIIATVLVAAILAPLKSWGHQDPDGEGHPGFVERDNKLYVYYDVKDESGYKPHRALVQQDGTLTGRTAITRGERELTESQPQPDRLTWDGDAWLSLANDGFRPGLNRFGRGTCRYLPLDWSASILGDDNCGMPRDLHVLGKYYIIIYTNIP